MKLGVIGCSHSSNQYGNPWHYYMGLHYGCEIKFGSSSGAGNEINIQKIKKYLDYYTDLDLFVIQLTDPSRIDIGIDNLDYGFLDTDRELFNYDIKYHTIRFNDDDNSLKEHFKQDFKIYDFFHNHVISSQLNQKFKIFHTLMSMQYLFDSYDKKVIFVSWFVDLHKLAKESEYENIIKKMNILEGSVHDFLNDNKIGKDFDNGHFGSKTHEIIFKEYINPQIIKYKING